MSPSHQADTAPTSTTPAAGIPAEDETKTELAAILQKHPIIHTPVNARGIALAILATVAFVFALQWAQNFFIPLVFSILISYTLTPVVGWLERIKIPRIIGITIVLVTLLCGAAAVADSLRTEFQSILVRLPDAAHQISRAITKT